MSHGRVPRKGKSHESRSAKQKSSSGGDFNRRTLGMKQGISILRNDSVNDSGSLLPFMIFLFILAITIYGISVNLFALQNSKLRLERWGEEMISDIYQDISYIDYYFRDSEQLLSENRKYVSVDCDDLLNKLNESSRDFPIEITLRSISCEHGQIEIILSENIKLPFTPAALSTIKPTVEVYIKGGLQQVSNE